MTSAAYHFLPWVREGMPAGISTADTLGAGLAARASIPVTVRLSSRAPGTAPVTDDISMPLRLYGPGDVIGIDAREIVRAEPRHLTPDFPPHLVAAVEFDRPDFPWLFTPAAPNSDRLRPWIVLVVVPKASASIGYDPNRPLPVLQCQLKDLPDLSESWMWAHAQFTGAQGTGNVEAALAANPAQTISRLLCPRRFVAGAGGATGYLACVVPAFSVGRKAGLGEAITAKDEQNLLPAWDHAVREDPVALPVYYSWEFNTAPTEGDFEDLVDRLEMPGASEAPRPALMDMSAPGRGLPEVAGATLGLLSALRPPGVTAPGWPTGLGKTFEDFQRSLEGALKEPNGSGNRVSPPIYGSIQRIGTGPDAGRSLDQTVPLWLRELNRDPRYRVAAAVGAQVVRKQQEQLVSSAWQQAGELADANRWLAQKQLAREVSHSVYEKRLKALTPGSLRQITEPVIAPAAAPAARGARTFPAPAPEEPLLAAVASAPFRRIARPERPLARHPAAATVAAGAVTGIAAALGPLLTRLAESPGLVELQLTPQLAPRRLSTITDRSARVTHRADARAPAAAATELLNKLDPSITYAREATARIQTTAMATEPASGLEPLAPLRLTPGFPQPMYEPLRDLYRDMLLPGLDDIPNNSVMVLNPDPAFIEAYLVGLNDELSRELLWREFPTDLRGTYFRQFWDVRSQLRPDSTEAEREALRDIPPIRDWKAPLGNNLKPERGKNLVVLLIKGDLLVRFPTAVIFAAPGQWSRQGTTLVGPAVVDESKAPTFPSLVVDPVPGVRLLGFDIAGGIGAAVGGTAPPQDPGWFIVIQEHPFEPRFGLNANRVDALTTWRKLAWPDVGLGADSSYIDASAVTPVLTGTPNEQDAKAKWGRTGADMAYITLQKAYRLEVHMGHWLT